MSEIDVEPGSTSDAANLMAERNRAPTWAAEGEGGLNIQVSRMKDGTLLFVMFSEEHREHSAYGLLLSAEASRDLADFIQPRQ